MDSDAPPRLLLSALTWNGWPTTVTESNGAEIIGTYVQSAAVPLDKGGMNVALGTVEYTPVTSTSFSYTRHAFTGTASSEVTYYGAILGDNMPPLIRICLPGRLPWPERFTTVGYIERRLRGPPFEFWDVDWHGEAGLEPNALTLHAVSIPGPDLPGQPQADVEPSSEDGREPDSYEYLGWQGDWATALLKKQDRHESLGERTDIIWNATENPTWGVQLRLQAIKLTERVDDEDESEDSRGISDYDVRATILRVFVKSEEIERLREPDSEPEEYEPEEYDSEGEDMDL
ncbi:hypothetical protein C8R44DRAFT_894638 [Mycena epipterygia]|nr:hypothetical protein C8R44DRAFT_894638 [Mycena epipterygia]